MATLHKELNIFCGLHLSPCLCSVGKDVGSSLSPRSYKALSPPNVVDKDYCHLEERLATLRPPLFNYFLHHFVNGDRNQTDPKRLSTSNFIFYTKSPYSQLVLQQKTFAAKTLVPMLLTAKLPHPKYLEPL